MSGCRSFSVAMPTANRSQCFHPRCKKKIDPNGGGLRSDHHQIEKLKSLLMANAPLQFIHISGIKTGRGIFIFDPIGRRDGLETRIKMKEAISTSLCIAVQSVSLHRDGILE